MRVLRFFTADGATHLGLRQGDTVVDLGPQSTHVVFDGSFSASTSQAGRPTHALASLTLDAPIRDSRKLLALAGNFRKHVVESALAALRDADAITPQVFWKPPTTINRPHGSIALRPANVFLDWEVELAVVIGKTASQVTAAEAMDAVFGYTVINDISERKF